MRIPNWSASTDSSTHSSAIVYWENSIKKNIAQTHILAENTERFSAKMFNYEFGPANLLFLRTSGVKNLHTRTDIARQALDVYSLVYIGRGNARLTQRGMECVIGPGECCLIFSDEPSATDVAPTPDLRILYLPGGWLRNWVPHPQDLVAQKLSSRSSWGRLLADAVATLTPAELERLALPDGEVAEQLAALLALTDGPSKEVVGSHHAGMLRRFRSTMRDRMHDPKLDPAMLAAEHRVSKRTIHSIFAEAGTSFGADLIRLRLERGRALLADRRFHGKSISEIGVLVGFSSPSHFVARFRALYRVTPAAYRTAQSV